MDVKQQGAIANRKINQVASDGKKPSAAVMINQILDASSMRKRFEELLGKRTPQFVSTLVTLVNANDKLQEAMFQSPMTVIQSALKAATFDLPIDAGLGYAYVVPFKNHGVPEAQFILGYKGMIQMALRTGVYKTINVTDVREGELVKFNRLTEEIELNFIEDDDAREVAQVVGYVGYYKLINGTEKTLYRTVQQLLNHEKKHRKGTNQNKLWSTERDAMMKKSVIRELIGKWGIMSIDYRSADESAAAASELTSAITGDDEQVLDLSSDAVMDISDAEPVEDADTDSFDGRYADLDMPITDADLNI